MSFRLQRRRLSGNLLATLPYACPCAGGPRPQSAKGAGVAFLQESSLCVLTELLGIFEGADSCIEIAEGLLCVCVDFLALAIGEEDGLR